MGNGETYTPTARKPKLIWTNKNGRRIADPVPSQVLEIVRPFQAGTQARLELLDVAPPGNRLIWTNDNLVALTSLVEGDGQHEPLEGKVDLVYIDPPFAVQTDFTYEVEIDEDTAGEKLPSLIEELAYTDTWREGLDSYLGTMRDRLELLAKLLSPTGTIFVHCDWHASHYLKVLLDELLGYDNFRNEVVWKRKTGRVDTSTRLGVATDSILFYSKSDDYTLNEVYGESDPDYIDKFFRYRDPDGRRYRLDNLANPAPRPNLIYEYKGYKPPRNGWAISREKMADWDRQGRLHFPKDPEGRIQRKRYLDELKGQPVLNLWTDVSAIGGFSREGVNFPTQKPLKLIERILAIATKPDDLVLDAFAGSGTLGVAAERMKDEDNQSAPRRWILIDCSKYAIHVSRKRLIEVRSRTFAVESVGFYQRGGGWEDLWADRPSSGVYRDALVQIYGGEPVSGYVHLHGLKQGRWVHIGPLDAPVSPAQIRAIVTEALGTEIREVDVLSADVPIDWTPPNAEEAGVKVRAKVIPPTAIEAVRERMRRRSAREESLVPDGDIHFFSPPDVELALHVERTANAASILVKLVRITVDLDDSLETQDAARRAEIRARIKSWETLIDYWAIDWDWQEGGPFQNDWQSFRTRKQRELVTEARHEYGTTRGEVRVAVKVTDVFGNDGLRVVRVSL